MPSIKKTPFKKVAGLPIMVCCCTFFMSSVKAQAPAIFAALKSNKIEEVKALLDQKVNVNVYDDDSDHVLMYAALYASADCMELLIKNGADVNAVNKNGETPLMWCNHDLQKTTLLLQNGAAINIKAKSGNTPLLAACVGNGQYEIVKFLLEKGADPLATNNRGHTALFRVASFGDTATASLLLAKGADINAVSINKETCLETAVLNQNKEMLYWLLAHGANANIPDQFGSVPLSYVAILNDDVNMLKALLAKSNDINCMDIDGNTALMWACFSEHCKPETIKLLLANGAMINLQDKKGRTALVWALKKGNNETVAVLKKAGAQQ